MTAHYDVTKDYGNNPSMQQKEELEGQLFPISRPSLAQLETVISPSTLSPKSPWPWAWFTVQTKFSFVLRHWPAPFHVPAASPESRILKNNLKPSVSSVTRCSDAANLKSIQHFMSIKTLVAESSASYKHPLPHPTHRAHWFRQTHLDMCTRGPDTVGMKQQSDN